MEFIINDKKLKEFFKPKLTFYEKICDELLKSCQEIELVAEGNIERIIWCSFKDSIQGKDFSGQPIKIYISKEVSKNV